MASKKSIAESIPTLTTEQIQELQVDEALRIMMLIDAALTECNAQMFEANAEYFDAKKRLEGLKSTKSGLVERARNLKAIVNNG